MSSYMTLPRIKLLNSVTSWMLHINKILNKISFKGTNANPSPPLKKKDGRFTKLHQRPQLSYKIQELHLTLYK